METMDIQSSIIVTSAAIEKLRREALASEVTETRLAPQLGMTRQTLASRYKAGNMKLSEFVAAAYIIGVDPAAILQTTINDYEGKSDGQPHVDA